MLEEGGLVGTLHNITQQKLAQSELAKLSLVASNTDNLVIITDAEGRTAHAVMGYRERSLAVGGTGYLAKPARKQELLDAVAALLAATPMASAAQALCH